MATTQAFRRLTAFVLSLVAAFAAVVPARSGDWMPLLPDQDFYDFQLFAPPNLQEYEIYPEPSEGIFFSYDRLYWGITPPKVTGVGRTALGGYLIPSQPISPEAIVQVNNASILSGTQGPSTPANSIIGGVFIFGSDPLQLDLNTSWMRTMMSWGNRYEGGWIYDNRGVMLSYFDTGDQSQSFVTNSEFAASSPTQIFTQQLAGGGGIGGIGGGGIGNINQALVVTTITSNSPPPDHLIAQKLTQEQSTRIQSAGGAMIIRRELGRRGSGSTVRFGFGPRFLQFEDRFTLGYESNQYAFNRGPVGNAGIVGGQGGLGGGGLGGGGLGGGGLGGGGLGGGGLGGGGLGGGGLGGIGGIGGGGIGGIGGIGGGVTNIGVVQTSAGDVLGITGFDTLTGQGIGSALQTGAWESSTFNNMVGPEFAMLLQSTRGRWTWSTELKFTAGFNWQNSIYRGSNFPNSVGADYLRTTFNPSTVTTTTSGTGAGGTSTVTPPAPPLFLQIYGVGQNNATNAAEHSFVFTPIGEWRLGGEFRVSQAITLRAGYTGMWLGSIARASTNTVYKSVAQRTQYAELLNPEQPAAKTNPWVVKTTGAPPPGATPVPGDPNTFKDAAGRYFTGTDSSYFRQDPIYNRIGPSSSTIQDYVFTNGVDFGIEVKY